MAAPKTDPRIKVRGGERRGPFGTRPSSSLWYGLAFLLVLGLVQLYYAMPAGRSIPYSRVQDARQERRRSLKSRSATR